MLSKRTLLEDLQNFLQEKSKEVEKMDMIHTLFLAHNDIQKVLARKLIGDIKGIHVTYSDRDFIAARRRKSPIRKLLIRHRFEIPAQFLAQRAAVSVKHLDDVVHGKEQEQTYVVTPPM